MELKKETLAAIKRIGFTDFLPIQQKAIPIIKSGTDLVAKSKTGSGKTHTFLIPIVDDIQKGAGLQALIVVPTRELASQIYEMAKTFAGDLATIKLASGGKDRLRNIKEIKNSDILISTLGRINDFIVNEGKNLDLRKVRYLVLDEVDMMMEKGFKEELTLLLSSLPHRHQTLTFSASINKNLKMFLKGRLKNAVVLDESDSIMNKEVTNYLIPYRGDGRVAKLTQTAIMLNPIKALVFATNIDDIDAIYREFLKNKANAVVLHSRLDSRERDVNLKRIHLEEIQFIICSDVMSRGMDIKNVTHVFNYDLPSDLNYFYHRLGRTGRNDMDGLTLTFYQPEDREKILTLFKEVKFVHGEYIQSEFKMLRPFIKKFKKKKNAVLEEKIKTEIARHSKKVKPNYKKKLNMQIEKIKKEHRQKIIKANLDEKRKRARANSRLGE